MRSSGGVSTCLRAVRAGDAFVPRERTLPPIYVAVNTRPVTMQTAQFLGILRGPGGFAWPGSPVYFLTGPEVVVVDQAACS